MTMKLGKTPARPGAVSLKFADYAAGLKITVPAMVNHSKFILDGGGVLGNDKYGDCVWAGAAHETIIWNGEAGSKVSFTDQGVLSDYSAVTGFVPSDKYTDQGTDMQVAASYRRKTGIVDATGKRHIVDAYISIKPGNKTELKQAIYLFSNVGIGIRFPASAMAQFAAGKPWTVSMFSRIEGGHYVPAIGYDSQYVYVVTWGKIQKMSWAFFCKYCDEAIVYLSSEMLSGAKSPEGFNVAQLNADLAAI